jgi:hypothetical protein
MMTTRLARPVGSDGPFTLPKRKPGPVGIGRESATLHYAPAARLFVEVSNLYENRRPKKSRAFKARGRER